MWWAMHFSSKAVGEVVAATSALTIAIVSAVRAIRCRSREIHRTRFARPVGSGFPETQCENPAKVRCPFDRSGYTHSAGR